MGLEDGQNQSADKGVGITNKVVGVGFSFVKVVDFRGANGS